MIKFGTVVCGQLSL